MMIAKLCLSVMVIVLSATAVSAATSIRWEEVDNGGLIPGFKTFDLVATSSTPWCCTSMLFQLSQGSFYQDPLGETSVLNAALFEFFPTLEFDTYLMENGQPISLIGAGGDMGGDVMEFSTTELDITWETRFRPPDNAGENRIARFSLSEDAIGSWGIGIAETGEPGIFRFYGTVADIVPEPGSLALLTVAAMGWSVSRRK